MEFKTGDRVNNRERGNGTVIAFYNNSIGVEYDSDFGGHDCSMYEKGRSGKKGFCWWELKEDIKKIGGNKMTKEDLKNGDIVTLRNGDRMILTNESFNDCSDENGNNLCDLDDLDNNLNCKRHWGSEPESDIIKIERPVKYETVFEREEVKELTVDEISEKLGYKVKVVGLK